MSISQLGDNLRRIMARLGLTQSDVVQATGLDERTVRAILTGANTRPHARTLHKLADGLGVDVDEFFQNPGCLTYRLFDRQTNPIVDEIVSQHPVHFDGWTEQDFDELYSRVGTGGALTAEGVLAAAEAMNRKREVMEKVALLLESGDAELLVGFVDLLYRKTVLNEPYSAPRSQ